MIEVVDALGRTVRLQAPAQRIVSLVPSETVSVADLAGVDRIVGRTDYCVEPVGRVERIETVGGTKGFDADAVQALRPDLVLANKEENSRPQVQALIDAGLSVHVSFPQTVEGSNGYLRSLGRLLGLGDGGVEARMASLDPVSASVAELLPVFIPIWKDPWMTFDGEAYASDVLALSGAHNVFSGRARRYPMAADLGKTEAWDAERVGQRDTRYPRIRLDEVLERGARAALLPDEPYAFGQDDVAELGALSSDPPLVAELVDGKDLFWYGTRAASAIERLSAKVAHLRAQCFGS